MPRTLRVEYPGASYHVIPAQRPVYPRSVQYMRAPKSNFLSVYIPNVY